MTFATVLLSKVLVATAIALVAEAVRRRATRPELAYALWVTVLAVLFVPSVISIPMPTWATTGVESIIFGWFFVAGPVVGFIWLVGAVIVIRYQSQSVRLIERLVRFAAPASASVDLRCQTLAQELGVRNCPTVVTAAGPFSTIPLATIYWAAANRDSSRTT